MAGEADRGVSETVGARTQDLPIKSRLLYQLSYGFERELNRRTAGLNEAARTQRQVAEAECRSVSARRKLATNRLPADCDDGHRPAPVSVMPAELSRPQSCHARRVRHAASPVRSGVRWAIPFAAELDAACSDTL